MNLQNLEKLDIQILALIYLKGPIKAKQIANLLSNFYNEETSRRDINSRIYSNLLPFVQQDDYFRWFVEARTARHIDLLEQSIEETDDGINYDSIVSIEYSNGNTLKFGFKGNTSKEIDKIDGVEYINFYAPLAKMAIGKKVGDILDLNGQLTAKILRID